MKTFAFFLLSKETFRIRTCSILESFFRKLLSKATFERKLSCVQEIPLYPMTHVEFCCGFLLRNLLQQQKSVRNHAKMQLQQNAQQT